jgi:hypothetical protein
MTNIASVQRKTKATELNRGVGSGGLISLSTSPCQASYGCVTYRVIVTACVIAPLVAATVNSEVVSLEPGPETPRDEPPHPTSEAEAARANIMSQRVRVSLSRRSGIQPKKTARAVVEVKKGLGGQVLAAVAATRVTVNLAEPLSEIVAGEKLHVAIVDEPEQDSETF